MPEERLTQRRALPATLSLPANARVVFPGGPSGKRVCKPRANKAEYIIKQGDAGLGG